MNDNETTVQDTVGQPDGNTPAVSTGNTDTTPDSDRVEASEVSISREELARLQKVEATHNTLLSDINAESQQQREALDTPGLLRRLLRKK